MFNNGGNGGIVDEMSVVQENLNENNVSFTPREFKKRRVIEDNQCHQDQDQDQDQNENDPQRRLNFDDDNIMQNKLSCVAFAFGFVM